MTAKSQNGWPVATVNDIHYYPIPGDVSSNKGTVAFRKGAVTVVLLDLAEQLEHLEPAVWPGIWGWFVKPISGSTVYSNHASGTALDWNAPKHPRQSRFAYLGWSEANVSTIHRLLATRYQGLIRWGADYVNATHDPMHFEINGDEAQINALAAKLLTPVPAPPPVVPPATEDDVMFLVSVKTVKSGYPVPAAKFLSNGIERRWIPDEAHLAVLVNLGVVKSNVPLEFDTVAGMNAVAGDEVVVPAVGPAPKTP
jgi:hypothetical protein